jgi:hypothetical protein
MSGLELLPAVVVGAVLLLLPGGLFLRALAPRLAFWPEERPAVWFVLSIALLSPAAVAPISTPVSIELALGWWFVATASCAAFAGLRGGPLFSRASARYENDERAESERVSFALAAVAIVAVLALSYGAFRFTRGGSIDRWWYLAFVRSWLSTGSISALDPMLGEGTFLARFAGNTWLVVLAAWARVAGVEPFSLYERAAPLLLAPLAVSATAFATRAVLESRRLGVTGAIAATLFWTSGSMFPALTRLPEDKLVAAIIVAPVLWALVIVVADASRRREAADPLVARILFIAAAAIALATTHPLVFGISLVALAPALLLARPPVAFVLAAVLTVTATLPVALGVSALEHVAEGESLAAADHPVGRIHLARDRVRAIGDDLQVSPRMLARPLTAIAILAGFVLALRRPRARVLLALPTALALALCFFPPLATTAAKAVGPWMIYRFLWAVPFVPLLVLVIDFAARWTRIGIVLPLAAAAVLAAPHLGDAIRHQSGPIRATLATPTSGPLPGLADALRGLPPDSVIAAAPELSERIPGLSGRRVLAASDRATVVFARSRESATLRLQSRAAALAGLWRATEGAPIPTHVVFEPGAPASRYCAREIFATTSHVLCEFAARDVPPGLRLHDAPADTEAGADAPRIGFLAASEAAVEGRVECRPEFAYGAGVVIFPRPGPWSARAPSAECTLRADADALRGDGSPPFRPRLLELEVATGRAHEEITIVATGHRDGAQRWSLRTRRRIIDGEAIRYVLPRGDVDRIDVSLIPSYLPFVKVRSFSLLLEPPAARTQ